MNTKAYGLQTYWIEEGHYYTDIIVYEENRNKAKVAMLKMLYPDEAINLRTGKPYTYIDIPVIRRPDCDLRLFRGEFKSPYEIEQIEKREAHNAHLESILADYSVQEVYITKRGDYYRSNYSGYTAHIEAAGIYTKVDAVRHSRGVEGIRLIPVKK